MSFINLVLVEATILMHLIKSMELIKSSKLRDWDATSDLGVGAALIAVTF